MPASFANITDTMAVASAAVEWIECNENLRSISNDGRSTDGRMLNLCVNAGGFDNEITSRLLEPMLAKFKYQLVDIVPKDNTMVLVFALQEELTTASVRRRRKYDESDDEDEVKKAVADQGVSPFRAYEKILLLALVLIVAYFYNMFS